MKRSDGFDPRLKLIWCLTLLITAVLSDNILTQVTIIALVFLTDMIFTGSIKKYRVLLIVFLIVASQIFLMQFLFNRDGTVMYHWWVIEIYSGALPAALLGTLRTIAVSVAAIQMMTWTASEDATLMLVSWGVPYRYAMLVTMTERFLPLLKAEYKSIVESQAVRGVPTNGVLNQIKMLPATLMPFLYRAVRHTSEIALSMELRGFGKNKTRTFAKDLRPNMAEYFFGIFLICAFIVLHFYFHI